MILQGGNGKMQKHCYFYLLKVNIINVLRVGLKGKAAYVWISLDLAWTAGSTFGVVVGN